MHLFAFIRARARVGLRQGKAGLAPQAYCRHAWRTSYRAPLDLQQQYYYPDVKAHTAAAQRQPAAASSPVPHVKR